MRLVLQQRGAQWAAVEALGVKDADLVLHGEQELSSTLCCAGWRSVWYKSCFCVLRIDDPMFNENIIYLLGVMINPGQ